MTAKPTFNSDSWRKSVYCVGESNCVEVAASGSTIGLRNSRNPDVVLTFEAAAWQLFIDDLKSGALAFDLRFGAE